MNTLDKVYDLTIDIKNIDVKYNSYAKFFDDDRETSVIRIKLLNDKTPINLENCIVEAYFILADNTYHNEDCKIINSSEGVVELQLCQKCLVKGENIVRLSILKDNEISNTPVITYEVRKGLYSDNPSFNDDPLTPILSQMLLDIKITKVNQIELQERYEKSLPKIEGKIKEVESLINRVDAAIASGTQDLEVKEARVDKNGKSYAKLGDRLDEVDSQLSNYYTKSETDEAMNDKANKVHTHNEYLTELPTHTHSEYLTELPSHEHEQYLTEHQDISHKADKSDIYTKIQTDNKISEEIAKAQLGGSGEVDLSTYATKNYVNEEIAKIEVGDKHAHSNLSVLNNITQTKVNEWNGKANASHTHSDYANKTHTHSTSDISNLSSYVSSLITDDVYINSLKSTIDTLSSELVKVKKDIEALKNNSGSANVPVTDINCSDWDVSLQVGQTKQITASVVPSNATNKLIHWYSDKTLIADVSSDGLITAKGVGYAKVTATTDDGGYKYDIHVNVTDSGGSSSNNLKTDKTSYTINSTEMLNISYTTSASISSSCAWELRQNGSYLCSAYKDTSSEKVVCYTGSLNTGTYNNITLVAKEYQTNGYVDIATSNVFSITVSGSSSGGSDSGSGGGGSTVNDEYALSCTSDYILDKMYPMGQAHEAIPNGNITGWKYNSRWENQDRPYAMSHSCGQSGCPGAGAFQALGCWSNIYRVEGTPFTQNTAVEMKDIKVYGWYNGAWELVQHLPVPNGNFYAESFGGDVNEYFADSVKQTSTSKTIILREANKINSENCMYHPFSNIKAFDTKYQYIYTCIDLRKVKWDENGIDDRDSTHYCSNCGGDWWLAEGLMFHDSWQHNKGVCQPKFIEITNEWRRFSMTTVPQGWSHGFPV
nr:MAG TPA: Ig-like domain protein [Caudoviricetes sp.]